MSEFKPSFPLSVGFLRTGPSGPTILVAKDSCRGIPRFNLLEDNMEKKVEMDDGIIEK